MEDQQIIRLFFERSEQAIAELAKAHSSAAARVARNILGSERDAEECLNDTYLAVWNAIPPQKPDPLRYRPQPLFEKAAGQFRAEAEQPV